MPTKKKNKKPQVTGLSMFIQHIRPELQRQGHNNKRMEELVQIAHPLWKELSAEERERFNDLAKEEKRKRRETGDVRSGGRLDNVGNLMSETVDLDEQMKKQRQMERAAITDSWAKGKAVSLEIFYIVTFEVLCKLPNNKGYLPAEIAIVEYSISAGIIRTFHRFIDPGPIPMGFRYLCSSTSDETHQIPIEKFDRAETDYRALWVDMCSFINTDKKRSLPTIFTLHDNYDKVDFCIDWLAGNAAVDNRLEGKIFELEILVSELVNHVSEGRPSISSVNHFFKTSSFDYESNTRCNFHEELENKYCALAVAKIHCFVMSDQLADLYDINLTGNHIPERSEPTYTTYTNPTIHVPPIRQKPIQKNGYNNESDISTGTFASRDIRYKNEREEDQPLRRPKGRGIAGSIGAASQPPIGRASSTTSFSSQAEFDRVSEPDLRAIPDLDYSNQWRPGVKAPAANFSVSDSNTEDWPSLGGPSASYQGQGAKPKKYANGKAAPSPSDVPQPAFSWRATGRGRGLLTGGVPQSNSKEEFPGLRKISAEEKTKQIQEMFLGTGRGRGVLAFHNA